VSVGLVPTMGALHDGHRALLRAARAEHDRVIMSLFVNPTQFGEAADFETYPRDVERDLAIAESEGVDEVYMPTVEEMYPDGFQTTVTVGDLAARFEGAHRPGHFDGVATVVAKLFNRTRPDTAYFGEKDAQQLAVIRRMTADLDLGVEIRAVATVREPDGLAISSRNVRLRPDERRRAASLHRAMVARDPSLVDADLDYLAVVDPETFHEIPERPGAIVVVAARFGDTRLIDTIPVERS
jgi:pantoate--beta-alanine ligase